MADQVPIPRNLSKKRPCRCKRKFGDGVGEFILYKGEIRGHVSIGMGWIYFKNRLKNCRVSQKTRTFDIRWLPIITVSWKFSSVNHRQLEIFVECGALEGVFGEVKLGCLLEE